MEILRADTLDRLVLEDCQHYRKFVGAVVLDSRTHKHELSMEMMRHQREGITPNICSIEQVQDVANHREYTEVVFRNGSVVMILDTSDNMHGLRANKILYHPDLNRGLVNYLSMGEVEYSYDIALYDFDNYGSATEVVDLAIGNQCTDGELDNFLNTFVINKLQEVI